MGPRNKMFQLSCKVWEDPFMQKGLVHVHVTSASSLASLVIFRKRRQVHDRPSQLHLANCPQFPHGYGSSLAYKVTVWCPFSEQPIKRWITSAEVPVDFDDMNLDMFMLWSESALKSFLALCSKNTEGDFSTLAAPAFNAYDERIPVDPDKEARHRRLQEFYKDKLKLPARFPSAGPTAIPEPFTLKSGWVGEAQCSQIWPAVMSGILQNISTWSVPASLWTNWWMSTRKAQHTALHLWMGSWGLNPIKSVIDFHFVFCCQKLLLLSHWTTSRTYPA